MIVARVTLTAELTIPGPAEHTVIRTMLEACDAPGQHVVSSATTSSQTPSFGTLTAEDGTRAAHFDAGPGPVRLTGVSVVELDEHAARRLPAITWDQSAALVRAIRSTGRPGDGRPVSTAEAIFISRAALPTALTPVDDDARDIAFSTFSPGQPLILGIAQVAAKIAERDMGDVDATHRMIAAMRAIGLAAAYVTGVNPQRGVVSWTSVYFPGYGWFAIDPLTARPVPETSIAIAWGCDASEAPLVRMADGTDGGATIHSQFALVPHQ